MKFFIAFALSITFSSAFADCREWGELHDLRKKHPQILSQISIQNQGSYGYCYAYAGKFLYDFNRYHKLAKDKNSLYSLGITSAAWAAALGMQQSNSFSDKGGFVCNVVDGLSKQIKNCLTSTLTNEAFYELGPQLYRLLFSAGSVLPSYQGRANPKWEKFPNLVESDFLSSTKLTGEKLKMRDTFIKFRNDVKSALSRRQVKTSDIPSAFHYYSITKKAHFANTYLELPSAFALSIAEKECGSWRETVKVNCEEHPAYNFLEIDREIERGRPVGISYCSRVLTDKRYKGSPIAEVDANCDMHASVLIGRKMNNVGQCQYLIRNSWGTDAKYAWPTENGDIWIDEAALEANIRNYQIVK